MRPRLRVLGRYGLPLCRLCLFALASNLLLIGPSDARIIRVALDGSGEGGATWEEAFQSIGSALVESVSGDSIWVKEGLYLEAINLKPGVEIYGGFSGAEEDDEFELRDWSANSTTVSAQGTNREVIRVFNAVEVIIDGLSVTRGSIWGGIRSLSSQLIVRNCEIFENTGVLAAGFNATDGSLLIENCQIYRNTGGSGLYIGSNNSENQYELKVCQIFQNVCDLFGGGVWLSGNGNFFLDTCLIHSNQVRDGQQSPGGSFQEAVGGGLLLRDSFALLRNCTLAGNLEGNLPAANRVSIFFARLFPQNSVGATIESSIIADATGVGSQTTPILNVSYSLFPTLIAGEGNITGDPMLASGTAPNPYTLLAGSPCIDTATRTDMNRDIIGTPRPLDVPGVGIDGPDAFDMGAYEFPGPFFNSNSDINQDGKVDAKDLLLLQQDLGR